jgi:hypothetical protein
MRVVPRVAETAMPAVVITSSVATAVVTAEQAAKNGHGRSDTSWLAGWGPGGCPVRRHDELPLRASR